MELGITKWGSWSRYIKCTFGISGVKLQKDDENDDDENDDHSALNGIRLRCIKDPDSNSTVDSYLDSDSEAVSIEGPFGDWDEEWVACSAGEFVTGIALRGMLAQGYPADDYGATNIEITCSDGNNTIRGNGKTIYLLF